VIAICALICGADGWVQVQQFATAKAKFFKSFLIRKGHGAENVSRLRRIALNLLQRDTTRKVGIKTKRLIAGWDHDYLLGLLTG